MLARLRDEVFDGVEVIVIHCQVFVSNKVLVVGRRWRGFVTRCLSVQESLSLSCVGQ